LRCWCNLNATVLGTPVTLDGFYGEKISCDLQPFGSATGILRIEDILQKANQKIEKMKQLENQKDPKDQLYLDIEFRYESLVTGQEVRNPHHPHYYDFERERLIFDF